MQTLEDRYGYKHVVCVCVFLKLMLYVDRVIDYKHENTFLQKRVESLEAENK